VTWKRIVIVLARVLAGGFFLFAGVNKLLDPSFLFGGLLHELRAIGQPFDFYQEYVLSRYVELHQELFAYAAAIGEVLVGTSLLAGALVSLGALGGCFLLLNFAFATTAGHLLGLLLHIFFMALLVFLGVAGAGVPWGVDGWLVRYINEAVVLFPFRRTLPRY
jgi:uncharacterized membrane protein YphA (DoxX/SURF4 family)